MEPGQFVNIHLTDPTERIWGRLKRLDPAGVVVRGIDVRQIDTFRYQFRKDQPTVFPQTLFFPMHRVLKIDLDEPVDHLPAIIESIKRATGMDEDQIMS